ncbi:MAG: hypothetical protein WCO93_09925 [bacterium]
MNYLRSFLPLIIVFFSILNGFCQDNQVKSVTVPFILDHNRMLVEAEIRKDDGTWRKVLLWVDTGNPNFMMSKELALDMGLISDTLKTTQEVPTPLNIRIGGMALNFEDITGSVSPQIKWLYNTMHNDGNLPAKVLQRYHVVFDYPAGQITIAEPGYLRPKGKPSPASVNRLTGIIQLDAVIDGQKFSFPIDNGSSFSYVPDSLLLRLLERHPEWSHCTGAVGCANIWGWWPAEGSWPLLRIPEITWGTTTFNNVIVAGLPQFFRGKTDVGKWYSHKTARPVNGFFGPNIFGGYRVEIHYSENKVYFEKGKLPLQPEMDIVGLTLKPLPDERYIVVGVAVKNGKPVVDGVLPDDVLIQIDGLKTTGATMGRVVDALRGTIGEKRVLILEREGKMISVVATVERLL